MARKFLSGIVDASGISPFLIPKTAVQMASLVSGGSLIPRQLYYNSDAGRIVLATGSSSIQEVANLSDYANTEPVTRSTLESRKTAGSIFANRIYRITDEGVIALGLTSTTVAEFVSISTFDTYNKSEIITRSTLASRVSGSSLVAGKHYVITDEGAHVIALSPNTYTINGWREILSSHTYTGTDKGNQSEWGRIPVPTSFLGEIRVKAIQNLAITGYGGFGLFVEVAARFMRIGSDTPYMSPPQTVVNGNGFANTFSLTLDTGSNEFVFSSDGSAGSAFKRALLWRQERYNS